MDCGEEVGRELVVAGGNAAEILQTSEHAFDGVARSVRHATERRLEAPVDLGRDHRRRAAGVDRRAHGVGVVATGGDHQHARRGPLHQQLGLAAIRRLAAGQDEGAWTAVLVAEGVEFGGAPTTADANRLRPLPPFPPAAQRFAFIVELSRSRSAGGPPASASA